MIVKKLAAIVVTFLIFASSNLYGQGQGCTGNPHFNDFDFWIGDWEVRNNANNNEAGKNTIEKLLNNCLVMENWQGAKGSVGKSINYFNPLTDKWRQVWVAPGNVIDIEGGLVQGSMVLVGSIDYFNDKKYQFRGTWTPSNDGSVRQFFEQYDADEKIWKPWFDGKYIPVQAHN